MNTNEEVIDNRPQVDVDAPIMISASKALNTTGELVQAKPVVSFDGRLTAQVLWPKAVASAVTVLDTARAQKETAELAGAKAAGATIQQFMLGLAQDREGFPNLSTALDAYAQAVESACLRAGVPLKQPDGSGKGGWRSSSTFAASISAARKIREALEAGCDALLRSSGLRGAYEGAKAYLAGIEQQRNKAVEDQLKAENAAKEAAAEQERIEQAARRDAERQAAVVDAIRDNPESIVGDLWKQFMDGLQAAAAHNAEVLAIAKNCALSEFGHVQVVESAAKKAA